MKTLFLIRHAKSDWNDASLTDFDRPLNERGKRDAPAMAHRLLDKDIRVDAFVSSPAKRARKTAAIFAQEFKRDKEAILLREELYEAPVSTFYKVISSLDDKASSIALFSHNPGITDFANSLTNTKIDNLPTCGIFAVKIDAERWADFKEAGKEFWFVDYPKAGLD
jgi:phosphohistidine phosphatase